jgi:hypothetical protein
MEVGPEGGQDGEVVNLLRFAFQDVKKTSDEKIAEGMGPDKLEAGQ